MNSTPKTVGTCIYCGNEYSKRGITRHLAACKKRQAAIEKEMAKKRVKPRKVYHLSVEDAYNPEYWMHLEISGSTKLYTFDSFLRGVWLECCGHLSQFVINDVYYSVHPIKDSWGWREEKSMDTPLEKVLQPDMTLDYTYDFGSSTDLKLKVQGVRDGKLVRDDITVMTRNQKPKILCNNCNEAKAVVVCRYHMYDGTGWLCAKCAKTHECYEQEGDFCYAPVVNSPRVGVCGYTGDPEEWEYEFEE